MLSTASSSDTPLAVGPHPVGDARATPARASGTMVVGSILAPVAPHFRDRDPYFRMGTGRHFTCRQSNECCTRRAHRLSGFGPRKPDVAAFLHSKRWPTCQTGVRRAPTHRFIVMLGWLLGAAGGAVLPVLNTPAAAAGDPAAGRQIFQTHCSMCHSPQSGQNGIGPALFGIVGTKSAAVAGYNFSPALRTLGVTWDEATLDKWLSGPSIPGTNMLFAGLKDGKQRADLIAYLATLK